MATNVTPEEKELIKKLYAQGYSKRSIPGIVGRSFTTVKRVLRCRHEKAVQVEGTRTLICANPKCQQDLTDAVPF